MLSTLDTALMATHQVRTGSPPSEDRWCTHGWHDHLATFTTGKVRRRSPHL
jgi:hypothetical protein